MFGENAPFGDLTSAGMENVTQVPMDKAEQSRVETIINEPRRYAMKVLSGYGTAPVVVDLTRADTYQYRMEHQTKIREEIALVYNMSNIEINLTGGEDTSGRATSESQERIEREKGIYPIVKMFENKMNREVLPFRWPSEYHLEFKSGMSDQEQLDIEERKIRSRTYSVNEIRVERGDEPFPGDQFELPDGGQPPAPDGSQQSPFNMALPGGSGMGGR